MEERNVFFDAVFDLLMTNNTNHPRDILKPQNMAFYFKTLRMDDDVRRTITDVLNALMKAAIEVNVSTQSL